MTATVRDHGGSIEQSAAYFDVPTRVIRAAVSYYAEFAAEIDADAERSARIESDERARWENEQAALA